MESSHEDMFMSLLTKFEEENNSKNNTLFTREKITNLTEKIKQLKLDGKISSNERYLLKKCVVHVGGFDKLVKKSPDHDDKVLYYVAIEDMFHIIRTSHNQNIT